MKRREMGTGRGTTSATLLGGIPLLFLLLFLLLGKFFRGSYMDAHEEIPTPTVSLYLLQVHRVGLLHT